LRTLAAPWWVYVHPFDDYPEPILKPHEALTMELPADVALGQRWTTWRSGLQRSSVDRPRLVSMLTWGSRIPAAGGTDAMANYASLRGPVGMNRVYARVPAGEVKPQGVDGGAQGGA